MALLDLMAAPTDAPRRVAAGREAVRAVQAALEQLPHGYSEAVRLVYLEGRSVAEAAEIMERTDRAIHNLCRSVDARSFGSTIDLLKQIICGTRRIQDCPG